MYDSEKVRRGRVGCGGQRRLLVFCFKEQFLVGMSHMIDKLLINKGLGYRNEEEQTNRVRPGTVRSKAVNEVLLGGIRKSGGNTRRRPLKMKR